VALDRKGDFGLHALRVRMGPNGTQLK
jgi:hypothetical protein